MCTDHFIGTVNQIITNNKIFVVHLNSKLTAETSHLEIASEALQIALFL